MPDYVYDTGALVAAERRDRDMAALHVKTLREGAVPVIPTVVLAQAWRGGPQPVLSRLLRGCRLEPADEGLARLAGKACAAAGTSDVVDAFVVATALARGATVVTSDPADIRHLGDSLGVKIRVRPV